MRNRIRNHLVNLLHGSAWAPVRDPLKMLDMDEKEEEAWQEIWWQVDEMLHDLSEVE